METTDDEKRLAQLYKPSARQPELIDVPAINFIKIDGTGDPNITPEYTAAVEVLYSLSYTLKFAVKKAGGAEYRVYPLEGLWWADNMDAFLTAQRDEWKWTMMIAQPDFITAEQVQQAVAEVERKKAPPALHLARFEPYDEGLSAQIMHIGPYAAEGPTIARLHGFIAQQGYALRGLHHEIYMSDPRRSAPEKLRTIIRQPVSRLDSAPPL